MRRWFLAMLLSALALFAWAPLWMLLSGSLMGAEEVAGNLGPVLGDTEGAAVWPLLPLYPTLRPYVELLLDSPEFFAMFWNSCRQVAPVVAGQVLIGAPAAWAFARLRFRGKKALFSLYIVLMLMPFQVTMVSSYLVLDGLGLLDTVWAVILPGAVSTFPVFLGSRGAGRRGTAPDLSACGAPPGSAGAPLRRGAGLSRVLECTGAAPHVPQGQDPLAAVVVSPHRHGGQRGGIPGGLRGDAAAGSAHLPLWAEVSGTGDRRGGVEGLGHAPEMVHTPKRRARTSPWGRFCERPDQVQGRISDDGSHCSGDRTGE